MAGAIWYRRHRRYDTTTRYGDDADTTTTMPDPCSASVLPCGVGTEGVLRRLRFLRHDDDD